MIVHRRKVLIVSQEQFVALNGHLQAATRCGAPSATLIAASSVPILKLPALPGDIAE